MLGSLSEAEDAVQEAWLRVGRAGADGVENFNGWLTTIVARICLNALRSRNARHEQFYGVHLPDPVIQQPGALEPETEAVLAESVGLALLVVLDTLAPAERLAFVLHDMFELPFDEIAPMVGRTPTAARQLASRARRRVKGAAPPSSDEDVSRQRDVVEAFFMAARAGRFESLVELLDPDVVLRTDFGPRRPAVPAEVRGAEAVAGQAIRFRNPAAELRPIVASGSPGVIVVLAGKPFAIMAFTVAGGRIVEIDVFADRERVGGLAGRPDS
jgi:RNA polymerase sigma-70 factor (ECF subfamily)